jgi:hypothetical protein
MNDQRNVKTGTVVPRQRSVKALRNDPNVIVLLPDGRYAMQPGDKWPTDHYQRCIREDEILVQKYNYGSVDIFAVIIRRIKDMTADVQVQDRLARYFEWERTDAKKWLLMDDEIAKQYVENFAKRCLEATSEEDDLE